MTNLPLYPFLGKVTPAISTLIHKCCYGDEHDFLEGGHKPPKLFQNGEGGTIISHLQFPNNYLFCEI